MNKPRPARSLADLTAGLLAESFRKQGFASAALVTRWTEIVGAEIAAHAQPVKIQWPRQADRDAPQPGTLVLRVEGPAAIEIQHLAGVIIERVNRFFGWQAIGKLGLRQAPLSRPAKKPVRRIDPQIVARIAETLPPIDDVELRAALARLGAAVKRR
ncbi:MAG: DUF721 domain-containing protein [Pseudorhodoplanes sp.]